MKMLSKCKLTLLLLLFTIWCAEALAAGRKPLSEYDLLELLGGGVYNARIVELIRQCGISFVPTTNDLDRLRRAGADPSLLSTIANAPPPVPQSPVRASVQRPTQTVRVAQFSQLDGHSDIAQNCKPGHMYSAHDVIGDPLTCIQGKLVCCGASFATGVTGAVSMGW